MIVNADSVTVETGVQIPVSATLRTLLESVIDYAGLFPPANLHLRDALRTYAGISSGPHAWVVDRFVVPAGMLKQIERCAPAGSVEPSTIGSLSLLVGKEPTPVIGQIDRIRRFREYRGTVRITAVEFSPLEPAEIERSAPEIPADLEAFFEVSLDQGPADRDARLAAIATAGACAKVRTGGVTAEAFPRATDLAQFMVACVDAGVSFKATAGLHHVLTGRYPVTDNSSSPQTNMLGFLNVAVAAALIQCAHIDLKETVDVLRESSAGAFTFTNDRLMWKDRSVQGSDVVKSRRFFRGFGSCSLRVPLTELEAVGWMRDDPSDR